MYVCVYVCVFFTARVGGALSAHGGTTPSSAVLLSVLASTDEQASKQASKQGRKREKGKKGGKLCVDLW